MTQEAPESFLGKDFRDARAVQRGAFGGQAGGDLVGGQSLAAQGDHPGADAVLGRCGPGRGPGFAGRGEQVEFAGAVVADQSDHRGAGVPEPFGYLGVGGALDEE